MNGLFEFSAAVLAGLVTADMFVRGWNGFLALAAAFILLFRKKISVKIFFKRLNAAVSVTVLCLLLLILTFKVYFSVLELGRSEFEQLGYFLGAVPRTGFYLMSASRMIDHMFKL